VTTQQQKALRSFRILIADPDPLLASVLKAMLVGMGFVHVHSVRTEQEAYDRVCTERYDFILTELSLIDGSGLRLVERIRTGAESPNPTIPVIAVSGRAEVTDVAAARDTGVNEFVAKPFTTQTIFDRMERIVEFPRDFLVSSNYVGPERRFRAVPWVGTNRRRTSPVEQPLTLRAAKRGGGIDCPRLLKRDYSLKRKLGQATALKDIITPDILATAHATVLTMATGSLEWISKDISELQLKLAAIISDPGVPEHVAEFASLARAVETRAGTLSFHHAAQVAGLLRVFARARFSPHNPQHITVAEKHIEVLLVILSQLLRESTVAGIDEIVDEVRALASRLA
jgi:CheY-like chemotaxis protein